MVKKLFKHELYSYVRLMFPMYVVMLGIALLGRIVQFFESESDAYLLILIPTIIMVVLALVAASLLTTIVVVVRFYRHLFSGEGYLTLTLPVTPNQHIVVKMLSAVLFETLTVIVSIASVSLLIAGDVFVEVVNAIGYLIPFVTKEFGVHLPLYIIEMIVLMFVSVMTSILLYYACIALGQTFQKNRVLASVGIYFGYAFAMGFVSTLLQAIFNPVIGEFYTIVYENPAQMYHVLIWISILFEMLLGIAYFMIVRFVLKKKLNLE